MKGKCTTILAIIQRIHEKNADFYPNPMRTIHLLIQPLQSNASVECRFSKMKRRKKKFFRRFVKFFRRFVAVETAIFIVYSAFGSIERVVFAERGGYSTICEGGILVRCSERARKKGALRLPSIFASLRLYSTINLCVVLFFPLIMAMV